MLNPELGPVSTSEEMKQILEGSEADYGFQQAILKADLERQLQKYLDHDSPFVVLRS